MLLDQGDLPIPSPGFELLFPGNGVRHVIEHFEMDKAGNFVARGETADGLGTMLMQATHQIARDANIDRAMAAAGENLDAGIVPWAIVASMDADFRQHDGIGGEVNSI